MTRFWILPKISRCRWAIFNLHKLLGMCKKNSCVKYSNIYIILLFYFRHCECIFNFILTIIHSYLQKFYYYYFTSFFTPKGTIELFVCILMFKVRILYLSSFIYFNWKMVHALKVVKPFLPLSSFILKIFYWKYEILL